jgi:Ran GTPase-activating protein (RanGAP) involved in mRNA processing and transport
MLERNRSLRTLDLVNTQLGADGTLEVIRALRRGNETLERLYLGANGVDPSCADELAGLIREHRSLRSLYLAVNRLGDDGVRVIAAALRDSPALAHLEVASNGLTAAGAEALAGALRSNDRLAHLAAGSSPIGPRLGEPDNNIGDEGANAYASAIAVNRGLRGLDLRRAGIRSRGAKALLDAAREHPSLRSVLTGRGVARRVKRRLREALAINADAVDEPVHDDVRAIQSVYR